GLARWRREKEPRSRANRLAIFGEAFHQFIGQRDLALFPVLRRKLPLGFRFDPHELPRAYVSPTGVAHLGVAHSRHQKKFKENAIAKVAGGKKPVQLLRLVYLGFSFHVARPIALLQQPGMLFALRNWATTASLLWAVRGSCSFLFTRNPVKCCRSRRSISSR